MSSNIKLDNKILKENNNLIIHCPDCKKEYPAPFPGLYRCASCYCKFLITDSPLNIKIIPYFDEMNFEPFFIMLVVLGVVLLGVSKDVSLSFSSRLTLFSAILIFIYALYQGVGILCRKYQYVDRFFRKCSRIHDKNYIDSNTLIRIDDPNIK